MKKPTSEQLTPKDSRELAQYLRYVMRAVNHALDSAADIQARLAAIDDKMQKLIDMKALLELLLVLLPTEGGKQ